MELTPEQKQRLRDSIDKVMRERKYSWTAEGPDGRVFEWHTFGIDGDNSLVAEVLVTMDVEPLKLGYYKILDSDIKNPYSVRLALEMVYKNKGKIKFSGNVPDFKDIGLPEGAIE